MAILSFQGVGAIPDFQIYKLANVTYLLEFTIKKCKNLTWNSRPPHCPHIALPYQWLCTSTILHQQLTVQLSPETQTVIRKDQDQPEHAVDELLPNCSFIS